MTATIAYDLPMKNLIDELVATGHVTTRSYRKDSVTIHHNGGRLSHEGVLNVWKKRPASAHFDVDGKGAPCQYASVPWYAWAVGNTIGNMRTISIEMANSTLGPAWEVADATWKGAARLAGWLFAKVIGARPSSSNFFVHSHWSATACAGPYVKKMWYKIMVEAQRWYDYFKGRPTGAKPKPPASSIPRLGDPRQPRLVVDGIKGPNTIRALQAYLVREDRARIAIDGIEGVNTRKAMQRWLNVSPDGIVGRNTTRALQRKVGSSPDGIWGSNTTKALQRFLNNHPGKS